MSPKLTHLAGFARSTCLATAATDPTWRRPGWWPAWRPLNPAVNRAEFRSSLTQRAAIRAQSQQHRVGEPAALLPAFSTSSAISMLSSRSLSPASPDGDCLGLVLHRVDRAGQLLGRGGEPFRTVVQCRSPTPSGGIGSTRLFPRISSSASASAGPVRRRARRASARPPTPDRNSSIGAVTSAMSVEFLVAPASTCSSSTARASRSGSAELVDGARGPRTRADARRPCS